MIWAEIENGVIVNAIVCNDPRVYDGWGDGEWVTIDPPGPGSPGIGWSATKNDDGTWTFAPPDEEDS